MGHLKQLPLQFNEFEPEIINKNIFSGHELGTFKDSMRTPIFRWFRYPAGFSYKFVEESFEIFGIKKNDWIYDPFSGTGTSLICAKKKNINAYGVEAHSFVHWVAQVKLNWEFSSNSFKNVISDYIKQISSFVREKQNTIIVSDVFPELIYKCYHPSDLIHLFLIREYINIQITDKSIQDFLKLALTDTLRGAAVADTGWPYIKPKKQPEKYPPKNALKVFQQTTTEMVKDIYTVLNSDFSAQQHNVLGDSRERQNLEDGQIKLAITSPPYLNNYDYADRTRLETYFWNITNTWQDITETFRDKLMVAATTQIKRSDYDVETVLSSEIRDIHCPTYDNLQTAIFSLSELRLKKGGKKSYDLMVALYFNGILSMLRETYRVLKSGGHFCLVLGDSAPYGIHVPTDDYIGNLATGLGFSSYTYHELRKRGGKWRDNPQRHSVALREGIVILRK